MSYTVYRTSVSTVQPVIVHVIIFFPFDMEYENVLEAALCTGPYRHNCASHVRNPSQRDCESSHGNEGHMSLITADFEQIGVPGMGLVIVPPPSTHAVATGTTDRATLVALAHSIV